jgi:GlpG protein
MRSLGLIKDQKLAELISDNLYAQKIENRIEENPPYGFEIWILDDDHIDYAKRLIEQIKSDPNNLQYQKNSGKKRSAIYQQIKENKQARNKYVDVRTSFYKKNTFNSIGPVTKLLLGVSIVMFVLGNFGSNYESYSFMFFSKYRIEGSYIYYPNSINAVIATGEFWRFVTPIFLHFGFLHIIFNMMWTYDLGKIIEKKHSSFYLLLLVVIIAIGSNTAQFIASGPRFGGMSGVIYGLLGFLWIRGKVDPFYQIRLNPQVVTLMIVWFFLCLFGSKFLGAAVGNAAHGVGLLMGMAWGYVSAKLNGNFKK